MANHKKQYCPKGHDTHKEGRLHGGCLACRREASRRRTREHPELTRAAVNRWYAANRARVKNRGYQRIYGISLEDYHRMVQAQNGLCLICTEKKDLVVDHDHKTGEVRGLLCGSCNRGIGYLKDSAENLGRAVQYLSRTLSPA